jgi:NADP-dependent 3-hydroxy acid dehydrogenase YdfG
LQTSLNPALISAGLNEGVADESTCSGDSRGIRHRAGDRARIRGAGGQIFVCDIDAKALENLKQEIPDVVTKVFDVSKREDIEQMMAFGVDALGGLMYSSTTQASRIRQLQLKSSTLMTGKRSFR